MGTKNNPSAFDCYANAAPDEPMFILLARDKDAPRLVREWVRQRTTTGTSVEKLEEALHCATQMERWRDKNCEKPFAAPPLLVPFGPLNDVPLDVALSVDPPADPTAGLEVFELFGRLFENWEVPRPTAMRQLLEVLPELRSRLARITELDIIVAFLEGQHVQSREALKQLQEAIAPDCHTLEDRDMWTHELFVREAQQLRDDSGSLQQSREACERLTAENHTLEVARGAFTAATQTITAQAELIANLEAERVTLDDALESEVKASNDLIQRIAELEAALQQSREACESLQQQVVLLDEELLLERADEVSRGDRAEDECARLTHGAEVSAVTNALRQRELTVRAEKAEVACERLTQENEQLKTQPAPAVMGALLLDTLKMECEAQHARAECLTQERDEAERTVGVYALQITDLQARAERADAALADLKGHIRNLYAAGYGSLGPLFRAHVEESTP